MVFRTKIAARNEIGRRLKEFDKINKNGKFMLATYQNTSGELQPLAISKNFNRFDLYAKDTIIRRDSLDGIQRFISQRVSVNEGYDGNIIVKDIKKYPYGFGVVQ